MKKYVIINKTTNEVLGKFDSKNLASFAIVDIISNNNEGIYPDEDGFLSIFDFEIKEEEEIQEITSYEKAIEFLGIKNLYKEGEVKVVETTPKYYKALLALSKLFTIAEAWNKEDGFIPDFSTLNQNKYSPWFEYKEYAKHFVCYDTIRTYTSPHLGSRLCFATHERALAFGEQFESLFNEFLMNE